MLQLLPQRTANENYHRVKAQLSTWREKANEQTEHVMTTGITAVGGFALGMADQRWGEDAVWGMSTSLAVALVGHGLALFEVGGKDMARATRALGNTGVAVYSYKSGFEMMTRRADAAPAP
jgi:hypothetical protein